MIHYTTFENWQTIQSEGLKPRSLLDYEANQLNPIVRDWVKAGCIWVYTEALHDLELLGMLFALSQHHKSTRMVELVVWSEDTVSRRFELEYPDDILRLRHSLKTGYYGSTRSFDLILKPVPWHSIQLLKQYDLRSVL